MKLSTKHSFVGCGLILPLVAGCLVFYGLPFGLVMWYSMVSGSGHSQRFVGLQNVAALLQNDTFRKALWNTLAFLAVGILLALVISYAIALLLSSRVRRHRLLRSVVLMPYVMPVVGIVLLVDVLFTESGLLNGALEALGLPVRDWLNSPAAFWVVVVLYLWKNTGYSVVMLLSGLVTIPEEQLSAAGLDGAGRWQKFRHIIMPQMWYSVFFAGVFCLINAFKSFREIFLIGGTNPNGSIYMLQHFINNSFEKLSYSKMAAASLLLTGIVAVLFWLCYRFCMGKEAFRE